MEVIIVSDVDAGAAIAADAVAAVLARQETPVIGLATGSSPVPVYGALIERCRQGDLSFSATTFFLLDEYLGLDPGDHRSYCSYIRDVFTSHVDVALERVLGPNGAASDPLAEADVYDAAIRRAGGIDLQLLGIGTDGHIGFNEPGSSLASRTRLKTLTERTRRDNARFFASEDDVPRHVLTQGVGTILESRHLLLVASGAAKAAAVAAAVEGPVSASCPASALQLHPHATVIVDRPAAQELANADYYIETFNSKPAWQGI